MAVYQQIQIIKDVRVTLDQNMDSDALSILGDVDTLALDDIIRSKIVDAVRRIHCEAPQHLLDGRYNFGEEIYWRENGSGWVLLPEDFMRFIVFEMDDWSHAVFFAHSIDTPEYQRQSSRYKGISGNAHRPLCFISIRPEGRVLEFYSCKSTDAQVRRAMYLPYPAIDINGGIEICKRCYSAVVYTIASLVLTTFGDTDKSNIMNELAKQCLI